MKLVTFDLDGVLMRNPFNRYVFPQLAELLNPYVAEGQVFDPPTDAQGHRLSPQPEEITTPGLDFKGRLIVAAILAETVEPLRNGFSPAAFDWDAATRNVAKKLGYRESISVIELVEEGCRLGYIATYPHAVKALQYLTAAGATLVAVTNGFTCYQKPVLHMLGLLSYFKAVVTPVEAGVAKPAVGIFNAARQTVGCPYDCPVFHVGDSVLCDVVGANAADIHAVWVNNALPASVLTSVPWERPMHPELMPHLYQVMRQEFAYPVYEPTPQRLIPHAVVSGMAEIPETIDYLWRSFRPHTAHAL